MNADPETAFEVFTDAIGRWWPLSDLSVHGGEATVAFEEGRIVERSAAGEEAVWGTVTVWEPGVRLAFTWHPGRDPARPSRVEVTFSLSDECTLVSLVHSGWEVFSDPEAARSEYGQGWPTVLGYFAALVEVRGRDETAPSRAGS